MPIEQQTQIIFQTYRLGDVLNDIISLKADVGTAAFAQTAVNVAYSDGTIATVAHSNLEDGNIPQKYIDNVGKLKGGFFVFITMLNTSLFSEDEAQSLVENLVVDYELAGGADGRKNFAPTYVANTGNIYELRSYIRFI